MPAATPQPLRPFAMGIDVGRTNVRAGLVDRRGQVVHFLEEAVPAQGRQNPLAETLVRVCREVLHRGGVRLGELATVGCATIGHVDPDSGVIVASPLPGWTGVDLKTPLSESFQRPVTVEGEGNAAALAAYFFGPSHDRSPLLAMVVGSGIDCGFIEDGRLLRGAKNAALEAGHMRLFHPGRTCVCGRTGCFEAHAGGSALAALLEEYRAAGHELPGRPEEVAELAQASHETCISIWEEQGVLLGLGIAILLDVLNPAMVVLSGGVLRSWNLFKKSLLKTAREKAMPRNAEVAIVCAPDPDRASLLGAVVAALRAEKRYDFFVEPDPDAGPA